MPDAAGELTQFERVLAERQRKAEETKNFKRAKEATYAPDLVPETQFERTVEDDLIDAALRRVGIVEAYNKWCGKMRPHARPGQKDGVMISCPIPGHRDSNPSAWANTELNTWYCGACVQGGDIYDLAAFHFNLPVPGYKSGRSFHDLRRSMVQDLGYVVQKSPVAGEADNIYLPDPVVPDSPVADSRPESSVEPAPTVDQTLDTITEALKEVEDETDFRSPDLDWRQIVPEGTFLMDYMRCCIVDDAAEEYHFWNGLVAIGLAVGRNVTLYDSMPVYSNLMLCILGHSGDRKSRSLRHLKNLVKQALPYSQSDPINNGIKNVQGAASGEALIASFVKPEMDPAKPSAVVGYRPVRALIDYSELSDLTGRAARQGSVIKTVLMQIADTDWSISTTSVTRGEVAANEPFGSVVTSTQPESLKDLISEGDTTSGFLNRWVFASGKPKQKVAIGGAKVDVAAAVHNYKRIHAQPSREIQWSDEAAKIFTEHFHAAIEPLQKNNPVLARLDLIEKKLILLLSINVGLDVVSEDIVHQVILMHNYLVKVSGLTSSRILEKSMNAEIYGEIMRQVERLTPQHPAYGPSIKQIKDCIKRKGWDPMAVRRIFDLIAKDDQIEHSMGDPSKPGRKAEHFKWLG